MKTVKRPWGHNRDQQLASLGDYDPKAEFAAEVKAQGSATVSVDRTHVLAVLDQQRPDKLKLSEMATLRHPPTPLRKLPQIVPHMLKTGMFR